MIYAIDPGSEKSAIVCLDRFASGLNVAYANIVENGAMRWNLDLDAGLSRQLGTILAVEVMTHIQRGGKEVIRTIEWAYEFIRTWQANSGGDEAIRVTVPEVVKCLHARGDKAIRAALLKMNIAGIEKCKGGGYHKYRALAVAVTAAAKLEKEKK